MSISLAEAKQHLEYEDSDRDDLITGYIASAKAWIENYTQQSMASESRQIEVGSFGSFIQLPIKPVLSIDAISYIGSDGVAETLAGHRLFADRVFAPVAGWPALLDYSIVTVTYETGVSASIDELHQAQRLLVAHWFDKREAVDDARLAELPIGVEALCGRFHTPTIA